jgi:cysteine-rich repeat protein
LIGSGQFSGIRGNFAADPRFVDADNDDFRLGEESPAAARATVLPAPNEDIDGIRRGYYPDLGAFERAATASTRTSGLDCGDGQVQWGPTDTTGGTFVGFETCDDGNQADGDGCSAFCQREASAAEGKLSFFAGNLCVVRKNGELDCWGDVASATPSGSFAQVATNQYYACALRSDGSVTCWLEGGIQGAYVPAGKFTSIASDGTQTCGLRADGGVSCWTDDEETLSEDGSFGSIATAGAFRVCALSAQGAETCWEPYDSFPAGPFLQIFPDRYGGCGLSPNGVLSCLPDMDSFVAIVPDAAFQRVSISRTDGLGIRPDGRVAHWRINHVELPPEAQQRPFIDVVGANLACGLTADDKVSCWNAPLGYPQE